MARNGRVGQQLLQKLQDGEVSYAQLGKRDKMVVGGELHRLVNDTIKERRLQEWENHLTRLKKAHNIPLGTGDHRETAKRIHDLEARVRELEEELAIWKEEN